MNWASQVVLMIKNLPANAGDIRDACSIPWSGRFPGRRQGNPLQYSCLENPWTEEPDGLQSIRLQRVRRGYRQRFSCFLTCWRESQRTLWGLFYKGTSCICCTDFYYSGNKGPYSRGYGLPIGHVVL